MRSLDNSENCTRSVSAKANCGTTDTADATHIDADAIEGIRPTTSAPSSLKLGVPSDGLFPPSPPDG